MVAVRFAIATAHSIRASRQRVKRALRRLEPLRAKDAHRCRCREEIEERSRGVGFPAFRENASGKYRNALELLGQGPDELQTGHGHELRDLLNRHFRVTANDELADQ